MYESEYEEQLFDEMENKIEKTKAALQESVVQVGAALLN